jgi:hypothetical protein
MDASMKLVFQLLGIDSFKLDEIPPSVLLEVVERIYNQIDSSNVPKLFTTIANVINNGRHFRNPPRVKNGTTKFPAGIGINTLVCPWLSFQESSGDRINLGPLIHIRPNNRMVLLLWVKPDEKVDPCVWLTWKLDVEKKESFGEDGQIDGLITRVVNSEIAFCERGEVLQYFNAANGREVYWLIDSTLVNLQSYASYLSAELRKMEKIISTIEGVCSRIER